MRVLGVDPGSVVCGYGVIESTEQQRMTLLEYGVIEAKRQHSDMPLRLKAIYTRLQKVIERSSPNCLAIETVFHSKSVSSIIKLAQARSAAILAASMLDIPIVEYAPRFVKRAVTGHGNANKEQVQFMVRTLLHIEETPEFYDATDALAVAICHSYHSLSSVRVGSQRRRRSISWKEFVEMYPERVRKG
ncbi:MAG: crossover junction endodeoxyribonuclease RuvC [Bacteroidota bacterium]|nr:crossover junction endodeoxyribonuclease RuvC [Candidatus Kapabacteria bacterium]MDW8220403.1 crossover junction endodeoxyribonuclease RuvC [Bacteroidota bacterium]